MIYPRLSHALPGGGAYRPLLASGRQFPGDATAWAAAFSGVATPASLWPMQDATPGVPATLAVSDTIGAINLTSNANGDEYYQQTGDPYGRYGVYLEDLGSHLRAASTSSLNQTTGSFSCLFRFKSVGSAASGRYFCRKKSTTANSNGWSVSYLNSSGHLTLVMDTPTSTASSASIAVNHADGLYHDVIAIVDRTNALLTLISDLGSTSTSIAAHAGGSVSDATHFGFGDCEGNLNACAQVQYTYCAFFSSALTSANFDKIRGAS